jgi:hypothetical protein
MDQRRRASDVPSGNFNNYTPRVIAENTVLSRVRRNGRAGRPRKAKTPGTKLVSVSRGLIIVVLLVAAIGTVYVLKPEYIDIAVEYIDNLIHPKPFVAADYDNTILHWHLENSEDEYIDRKLVMYGTVKEVTHIGTRHPRYLIAVNDDDSTLIWANTTSKSGDNSSTFGEGDRIWIYGTFKGNESYQTIMNSAVKHPTITVDKIESHA